MNLLYLAVFRDPVTRRRLAEWTIRSLRPLGIRYADADVSWQWDGGAGVYLLVGREYVAWSDLTDFIISPEATA